MPNLVVPFHEAVRRFRAVHGQTYSYSSKHYTKISEKMHIRCPVHGLFSALPSNHLAGTGCPKCGTATLFRSDADFRKALSRLHPSLDFRASEYHGAAKAVFYMCKEHGKRKSEARRLLSGIGCTECNKVHETPLAVVNAIARLKKQGIHVCSSYVNARTRMLLQCTTHGKFYSLPHNFSTGCVRCSRDASVQEGIQACRKVHGDRYTYSDASLLEYSKTKKIVVVCDKHGTFKQSLRAHKGGQGCPECQSMKNPEFFHAWKRQMYSWKKYRFPDGRCVQVQGFEPLAIDYLLRKGTPSKWLHFGAKVPSIAYSHGDKEHTYYPDLRLGRSTLVEVKSTYTWARDKARNIAKLNAALRSGYKVRLLVFNGAQECVRDIIKAPSAANR